MLAVIGSSIWTWTIEQVDGLDWIFFQFKLDKTGHGLLIFGSYLDSFFLDMDFDPFPGVATTAQHPDRTPTGDVDRLHVKRYMINDR